MIKPHAVQDQHVGAIIAMIEEAGFTLKALQMTQLSTEEAGQFYEVHKDRPFYEQLCQNMAEGPIVVMILEKKGEDAVAAFRKLLGPTNPTEATPGTIRHRFGRTIDNNAVHGSDAPDTAVDEIAFFFGA